MDWAETENNKKIYLSDIPTKSTEEIKNDIKNSKFRVIGFFGKQENENTRLYTVLSDNNNGKLYVASSLFNPDTKQYNSLTQEIPALHIFEREFYEEFNIEPKNHPWLKPVRNNQDNYAFFEMKGGDVHEVAVGPIHAGVIEPGHFRFMCHGEKVYNLEIMLGYQHRGVENLLLTSKYNNRLAESICGDTVIGHNMAYSQVIEELTDTKITPKAEIIRNIALEMERIAIHIGDMGAIAGDMAYLMGSSVFGVTRTLVINTMLEISGSRFGRGLIDVGGVNFDIDSVLSEKIVKMLYEVKKTVARTTETILKAPSCISRMERTGTVSKENALLLGAVGMAARSSGVNIDSRFDLKNKWYLKTKQNRNEIQKFNQDNFIFKPTGDVYSRFVLRYREIEDSIYYIKMFLKELEKHKDEKLKTGISNKMKPNSFVASVVEGWRGEIVHIAITDENSNLQRYKIKDASFNNWYMLAMAVRNNGISDFPLCNKSFNLSYCGNDL